MPGSSRDPRAGGRPWQPLPSLAGAGGGGGVGSGALMDHRSCPHLWSPVTARRGSRGAETLHRGPAATAVGRGRRWHASPGDAAAGCYLGLQAQGSGREAAMPGGEPSAPQFAGSGTSRGSPGTVGGQPPVGARVLPSLLPPSTNHNEPTIYCLCISPAWDYGSPARSCRGWQGVSGQPGIPETRASNHWQEGARM